jgi:ribonuclease III
MQEIDIRDLAKVLGIKVEHPAFFQEALTHRSYLNENRGYPYPHNERLEFLGDAVLELIVTEFLFEKFPQKPEGELTNLRAALVNGEMLGNIGKEIGLDAFLLMSRGESKDTGRARSYLVANAMEAVIGALYKDQGYLGSKGFIEKNIFTKLDKVIAEGLYTDAKSYFQEKAQAHTSITPSYRILEESGPDHDRKFVAGVYLEEELVAQGEGASKQEAQRSAAKNALEARGW